MKSLLTCFLLAFLFSWGPALAQPNRAEFSSLQALQLTESQVQDLFSLVLSRLPLLLNETTQPEQIANEIAPQALRILNSEQRDMLTKLLPTENLNKFGSMSREERTRYLFESAKSLSHPSQKEWLERAERMTQ